MPITKNKKLKLSEFIVMSDYGYFCGLAFGGEPQWSMKESDAKPLNHLNKFYTLQSISRGLELIYEFV
jgi:hypothetical protein